MTTGEGGMVVTNNAKIYELCSSLRNQGRSPNMQWLDHERLGYNYRMDEMSAALGLAQLSKLDYMIEQRRVIAALYNKHFLKYSDIVSLPQTAKGNTHTWFVYVVRIKDPKIKRDNVIEILAKQGISTKPYLPSIHLFSFYKNKFGFKRGDFPISEAVSDTSLALPFYIGLKDQDIKHIVAKVIAVIKNYGR